MARIRADYVFGTTDAALTASDTTLSSAALSRLPAVSGSDVAAITLHDSAAGVYEIVHVTAHTTAATTATILRGQEGSTAQAWASGAAWNHGPTAADLASGTLALTTLSDTTASRTNSSGVWTEIPGAAVSFVTPESGAVIIEAKGGCYVNSNTSLEFRLHEGGAEVVGTMQRVVRGMGTEVQGRYTYACALIGLTSGASKTYQLAFRRGDGVNAHFQVGDIYGQFVMEARRR